MVNTKGTHFLSGCFFLRDDDTKTIPSIYALLLKKKHTPPKKMKILRLSV